MRVSIGTAHLLGLKQIKIDALPTTAYLMHGEGCRRNCKFCAQAKDSESNSKMLSRIIWPEYDLNQVIDGLHKSKKEGILKRCCIQVVDDGKNIELEEEIKTLANTGLPLCVSKSVKSLEEIERMLNLGVDRITIALDAINPVMYEEIKGGSFEKRMDFLKKAARTFPGRIGTHIIVGLGETEEELIRIMCDLAESNVLVALFAFTPLKGTPLKEHPQPDERKYRRSQIARYLIFECGYRIENFKFSRDRLVDFNKSSEEILSFILNGKAFETSGCPDCNRPYYNERPGGVIYNYPIPLIFDETLKAIKMAAIWSAIEISRVFQMWERKVRAFK
ncbi:MAG: radical SAM protein [Halanaerobiales bacterium]|nr:radical SAM protein [Halanaerobiales bacterium]